jgi:hypothetical protein
MGVEWRTVEAGPRAARLPMVNRFALHRSPPINCFKYRPAPVRMESKLRMPKMFMHHVLAVMEDFFAWIPVHSNVVSYDNNLC